MLELITTLLTFFAPSLMLVASSQSGTKSAFSELNNKLLNKCIEASQNQNNRNLVDFSHPYKTELSLLSYCLNGLGIGLGGLT